MQTACGHKRQNRYLGTFSTTNAVAACPLADLPARTDQSRESKQQQGCEKFLQRILQSIGVRFKMYVSSRQHSIQTPIRLSYFSMPFWRRTFREDSGKIEQLPKHSLVIVQSLLVDGVVRNTSTLKIVVEEFARRLQTPYLVISDLFLEDSAHAFSSEIRRHRGAFPNECGHETKSHWAKHYVWIVVCAKCGSARTVVMDNKLFFLRQPNVKYVNDPQKHISKNARKHFNIKNDPHASVMWSTMFKNSVKITRLPKKDENVCDRTFADNFRSVKNDQ